MSELSFKDDSGNLLEGREGHFKGEVISRSYVCPVLPWTVPWTVYVLCCYTGVILHSPPFIHKSVLIWMVKSSGDTPQSCDAGTWQRRGERDEVTVWCLWVGQAKRMSPYKAEPRVPSGGHGRFRRKTVQRLQPDDIYLGQEVMS